MAKDRNEVIEALKRGALGSGSEYVTVRREDLLAALGAEPRTDNVRETDKDKNQP